MAKNEVFSFTAPDGLPRGEYGTCTTTVYSPDLVEHHTVYYPGLAPGDSDHPFTVS